MANDDEIPVVKQKAPSIGRGEMTPLELDGHTYTFKYEPRCAVCTAGREVVSTVNKMLVEGSTYTAIARHINPGLTRKITYASIRIHSIRHMPPQSAAVRAIIERRSQQMHQDFVEGTNNLITPYIYAEVTLKKAFDSMVKLGTQVSVKEGLDAAKILNEFTKEEQGQADITAAMSQLNQIITAVRTTVPPEMYAKIIKQLQSGNSQADVVEAEVVREDENENDVFDPVVEEVANTEDSE